MKLDQATIADIQAAYQKGTLTAEKLTQLYLARIAAFDKRGPAINTVIMLNPNALAEAKALDAERKAGKVRGPLHGVPIVLKDNYDTFDLPTTAGSQLLEGSIPPDDAFAQNGNCSCTAGQPTGGKLACPGTSTLANGGQNCVASTCEAGNTQCGVGAGCNPISSPPNLCFFTLPKPTKFPVGSNPWTIPQNNEVDLCIPPAQIRSPYDNSAIFSEVWWSGGMFAPAPDAGDATRFYRQLSRYSSAFALCADMALLTLGGALKRKEMLSARFGDILSELYLLSAALKRWQDEGRQSADFAALEWCMATGFKTIENRFAEILANLPNRFVAIILKFLIQPFGARAIGPSDLTVHRCAQLVLEPSAARDRLTPNLSFVEDDRGVARLEKAFMLVTAAEDISKRMHAAHIRDWHEAVKKGVITQGEGDQLAAAHEAVSKVIEVDDFAPEALSPIYKKPADVHQFFQELGEQRAAS